MSIQDLISKFSEYASTLSEKTMTFQEVIAHPITWVVVYILVAATIGYSRTKAFTKTFEKPYETPDYLGATFCLLTSPVWIIVGAPIALLFKGCCKLGERLCG